MIIKKNVSWNDIYPKSCREEMIRDRIKDSPCETTREIVLVDLEQDKYDLKYDKLYNTFIWTNGRYSTAMPNGNYCKNKVIVG
jgi:hypothetical protein